MPKASSTWSSIWRCWAVTQTRQMMPGVAASRVTTGAILIASGRVPNTQSTLVGVAIGKEVTGSRLQGRGRPLQASGRNNQE